MMRTTTILCVLCVFFAIPIWAQSTKAPQSLPGKLVQLQKPGQPSQDGPKSVIPLTAEEESVLKAKASLKDKILQNASPKYLQSKSGVKAQSQQQLPTLKPIKRHKAKSRATASSTASNAGSDTFEYPKDNPQARADFELRRTKDPQTGLIPKDIRMNELNFMKAQNAKIGVQFGVGDIASPWINRGPFNVGGRTRALAVDVNDENVILAGGVSGGMWRSADQGATWAKTTGSNELQSVSCIAQDPRAGQTSTWYYGTGEISGNSAGQSGAPYRGDGVYKSTDNGLTWNVLDATSTDTPEVFDQGFDYNYELAINPVNGNVLVANNSGVYLSTDGGTSFTLTLENTGFSGLWVDVVMSSTGEAFAVIDDRGVFSSTDGTTWTDFSPAISLVSGERKELTITEANGVVLYMLGEDASTASSHSLWRYDQNNLSWSDLSANVPQLGGLTGNFDTQGGYDVLIKVKPDDENFVVIGGTNLFASSDGFSSTANTSWIGGYTATNSSYGLYASHHPDQHSFVFLDNDRALSGNDGGVQITSNVRDITQNGNLETVDWVSLNNGYLTTQVYALSAGPGDQIMAGFQDNSTWLTTSTDSDVTWTDQFGGDGAYNAFNNDGSVRYMSSQNGNISRVNYSDGADDITANGFTNFTPDGYGAGLFIVPFYVDPVNDDVFYLAGNNTFYVNTQANTGSSSVGWKTIDLSANGVISEIGVTTSNIVYVGTSAGEVFKVNDPAGTESVTNVTSADFPSGYISGVGVNQFNPNDVIVTFSNYSVQSVFHSTDGGSTWASVSGNLEENADGSGSGPSIRSGRVLGDSDRYFVGTSTGLYSTASLSGDGTVWVQENGSGIGDVVVEHLVTRQDGLVLAGTHGNGIYSSKFEVSGAAGNDLALTTIVSPEPLVSGEESITVSISNLGTAEQSSFDLTYYVNDTEVATETFTGILEAGTSTDFTFATPFDFSSLGEYTIRAELVAEDENTGNNSVSKFVVNALFTGKYILSQNGPTSTGVSTAFGNGYLFSPTGTDVVTLFYVDENTRGAFGVYMPAFQANDSFYEWSMIDGEVIFSDNQETGLRCVDAVLLGTADSPGAYTIGDDAEFSLTLKEDVIDDCGVGSSDVTFSLLKQVDNDLALTSIISPAAEEFVTITPITVTVTNTGVNVQNDFSITFYVDGEEVVTETYIGSIEPSEVLQLTFDTEVEFSEFRTYEIKASVSVNGDERASNDEFTKTIEIKELVGFEGPYLLEQIEATSAGTSFGFANGLLFDPSGTTSIFIENLSGGERQFSASYLPAFNGNQSNFRFSLIEGQTYFADGQSTGIGCAGTSIELGTADSQGTYDVNDANQFLLNLKEDITGSCSTDAVDVAFRLVKVPAYNDLGVVDLTNPEDIFPNRLQFVQAAIFNYSNVPQEGFTITYSVNGEEVATEDYNGQIGIGETGFHGFQTQYDFSTPGFYEITARVNLENDEFPDNDLYTKSVQSLAPIADFPYDQTFDQDGGAFPEGWRQGYNWELGNALINDVSGPLTDHTSGSGYYAYTNGSDNVQSFLTSRHVDLSQMNSPLLTFYYHMFGTHTTTLDVRVNGAPVLSVSGEQQASQTDDYIKAAINLANYGDQVVNIDFVTTNLGRATPEIVAIDDIRFEEALDHDLAVRTIMSPATKVSGDEAITATIANLGSRAQSEFDVSYYVNGTLATTELFTGIIGSGQEVDFTFGTQYDFSAVGVYDLSVVIDLPTDELIENNTYNASVSNDAERLPFAGRYILEQLGQTSTGPSTNFGNGFLFSDNNVNEVELVYVDENTRSVSLTYLSNQGNPPENYEFILVNGEALFSDNQSTGLGCVAEILLGTAADVGAYDSGDDTEFTLFIREDVTDDCGSGSVDVPFKLTKIANSVDYDLAITAVTAPQQNIPLSRQAIGFAIENVGNFPQGDFEATYYVDGSAIASQTFPQTFPLGFGASNNFIFEIPFEFSSLDVYDITVKITRAADDNPENNEASVSIQTSVFNINAVPINNSRIGVEWLYLADVSSTVLERSVDGGETFEEVFSASADDTYFVDETVDTETLYAYRLRGVLGSGDTNYSSVVSAQATIAGDFAFNKVLGDITGVDLSNNTYSSSWADLDDDGDLDMVVSNIPNFNVNLSLADAPSIYLNDGDGNFEKIVDNTVISDGVSSRSASVIDYNNDGKPDVFLSGYNSRIGDFRNRLFRNNGNLDFTSNEVPAFRKTFNSEEGSWADVDNDGDLDLFVAGGFQEFNQDFIYENRGDGRFESVRTGTIYETLFNSGVYSWAASWVDYDNDGDQDLFVPNDVGGAQASLMFRNLGDGTFEVDDAVAFVNETLQIRGAQWADFDQDGWQDLVMIDRREYPIFYFNNGDGTFERVASIDALGTNLSVHRISTVGDVNNNGKLDIIFASGGYSIYESNNDRTFTEIENAIPEIESGIFAGMSLADMDGDGDLDMFRGNASSGYSFNILYENQGNANNWLHLDLQGEFSNADGIGTKIALTTGEETQYRTVTASTGLMGQNSLIAEFGLGLSTMVDHIVVTWPTGTVKEFFDVEVNQLIQIDDSNAPTDVGLSNAIIPENLAGGTAVGASFSVDIDNGDAHSYEIVSSGSGSAGGSNMYLSKGQFGHAELYSPTNRKGREASPMNYEQANTDGENFFIENGTIKASTDFDFEDQSSYSIRVRTTDGFGNTFEKVIGIDILDVNEDIENSSPTDITLSATRINENEAENSMIGMLTANDSDEGSTHTFSLVDGDAALFQIDGDVLMTTEAFNFEAKDSYTITIRTIDNGGLSLDKEYVIAVDDVNEEPVELFLDNTMLTESLVSGSLVGALRTDDTDLNDEHAYTLSGADAESFQILGDELLTLAPLDFETKTSYEITIVSEDGGGLTTSKDFVIQISDENDAPSSLTASGSSIEESLPQGSVVATLSTIDDDVADTHTYSLSGADADKFKVLVNELRTATEFNFEEVSSYDIVLTVTDDRGLSYEADFMIAVEDVNDLPTTLELSNSQIPEALGAGTFIGTFSTQDEDSMDAHTFTLTDGSGGDDNASFTINEGVLVTAEEFDFETKENYSIRMVVSDGNGGMFEQQFTIDVLDIDEDSPNQAPSDINITTSNVTEDAALGTVVGMLSSIDADASDTHEYTIINGATSLFTIEDGMLKTNDTYNFEVIDTYELTIRTTDQGGLIFDKDYTIGIDDVNEAPNTLALSNNALLEGLASGTVIGAMTSTDDDAGDSETYTLSGPDAANFDITGSDLKSAVVLDFEIQTEHNITITVTDAGGLTLSKDMTISVTDENETPSAIALSASTIAEGQSLGTIIGSLSTTDVDAGDSHTYSLSGADAGSFQVVIDQLRNAEVFDFESQSSFAITVTTTDANGLSTDVDFTITIGDENDAPTAISLTQNVIVEGEAAGTAIGLLSLVDQDASDTEAYAISGLDAALFQVVDNQLQTADEFNFEAKFTYNITISGSDAAEASTSDDFVITVSDKNEVATNLALSANVISEGVAADTFIGDFSFDDEDAGDTHTITLTGADATSLKVVSGQLLSTAELNFEEQSSLSVTIVVTDAGGLEATIPVTVDVTDINEAPTSVSLSSIEIQENAATATVVGMISVADEDTGDTQTLVLSGTDAASFELVGTELRVTEVFDFEMKSSYAIDIMTTDAGDLSISESFTIAVVNENEAPSSLVLTENSISEGLSSDTVIGEITFDDEDVDDTHTITVTGDDAASFKIVGSELQSAEEFNFEIKSSYDINIVVTDAGGLEVMDAVTIGVTDENDAPSAVSLSNLEVLEEEVVGTVVGILAVADEDGADTHTLTLSGTDAASFEIVNNELVTAEVFDFDAQSSYSISVEASDGALSTTENFTITVINVLGIDNNDHLVNVYPNPSNGIFTVSLDKSLSSFKWNLYDLKGNRIQTTNSVVEQKESSMTLDVSDLSAGQYILEIVNANKRITKQIIIVK